ncbi:Bug family tripartite tricarboxylate transporter substrate binding protein [Pigmentiphaga litoralis]|uniref:Bug family tripartite tricarboxylate transporter substrate binding protein n=1 Tax=Pigmentiphaga litoralis TaxID=516702 RepID=UPI003B43A405
MAAALYRRRQRRSGLGLRQRRHGGPALQGEKVKLLALAAPKRLAEYGDIPTVSEAGGPANFELKTWVALFGPRGMPKAAVDKINAGINQALNEPDVLARMANFGFESWRGTPADITKAAAADSTRFAKIVGESGITLD